MKTRGLVAEVRRVVNVKDSFTRMSQEREREAQARSAEHQQRAQAVRQRQERIDTAKREVFGLYAITDPYRRGTALEGALGRLFAAYDILIAQNFRRKGTSRTSRSRLMVWLKSAVICISPK